MKIGCLTHNKHSINGSYFEPFFQKCNDHEKVEGLNKEIFQESWKYSQSGR